MAALEIAQVMKDDRTLISLTGKIDEHADFTKPSFDGVRVAIFDFDKVSMINSMGIQAWIAFMKRVPDSIRVGFRNCPLRIINQINLFPDFLGGRPVSVVSFYAPYFCEECDEAHSILLKTKDEFPAGKELEMPERACPKCKEEMEFGAVEEKYLLFLSRSRAA